ncbi:allophanate hydrolase [Paenibacillus chartarius]|uniref:Allophanate hydrolase n=1 Tax=Paenibacillus chartarius TaxID=747481 RepID=A0ABV6DF69_9BACL
MTWTISGLREQYRQGTITPAEIVADIVRRAEADKDMNIWITPPAPDRIQPYVDALALMDPDQAPLWGIPFAVKDNIDVAGMPTTAACPDYAYVPDTHATVVDRLVAAGAIPVGKANLDQFATGLVGTRSPYGETHNGLRPELISGGSSSGSAVAVARGHAAFALGTDTAGSGRVPAALHGLVGYKPAVGAWPVRGVVPACASLDCVTAFTHTLADALTVDAVVRGADALDPWSRASAAPAAALPARVLLPREPLSFYGPWANDYERAWQTAAKRWERQGIQVEYIDTEFLREAAALLYEGPWVAERWAQLGEFIESHPGTAFPVTERILRSGSAAAGSGYDAASVFQAIHRLQALKLEAKKLLQDAVLVLPTCGGTWTREQVRTAPIETNRDMGRYTNHCNLLDLGAIAVPAGEAAAELPFGVTLFALAENEGMLAGAAAQWTGETGGVAETASVTASSDRNAVSAQATTLVAVCGLHMRGFPLEKQMLGYGARFVRETVTAPVYQLVKLPTEPAKPGMIKRLSGGAAIALEVWEMPLESFGGFVASIPAPLGIGKVELADGTAVPGFVCEAYAAQGAADISAYGGWRQVPAAN